MKVREHADRQYKSEVTIRESQVVRIAQTGRNGRIHPGLHCTFLSSIQHPCDRIHRLHEIAALGQCHCALSAATPNFKDFLSSRQYQLVDPAQHNLQALSVNRAFDSIFCINVSPLRQVRLKVRIYNPLVVGAVQNSSLKYWRFQL
jgi:hypothetical protein